MIDITGVSLKRSGKTIINHVDLLVNPGEKYLITGKSGSGKSSLFHLILGFDRPNTGSITINGRTLSKETIRSIRGDIFYLSQDVELPELSGTQLVVQTLELNGCAPLTPAGMALHLKTLSLSEDLLSQKISTLSGGERQRIGLLLCFLLNRPIWLLDEPTAALDPEAKSGVATFISGVEQTVIVISHDPVWQQISSIRKKALN